MGEHWSFLEPPRLVCSLISKTFLVIRAETHRNHFLFIYVDFLFYFWVLETPDISVGPTLPQGCGRGAAAVEKVTYNEIRRRRWFWGP